MRGRGLNIKCPRPVADRLRAAGWIPSKGYWRAFAGAPRAYRWWDALAVQMASPLPQRQRKQAFQNDQPAAERCQLTADLFRGEVMH